MKHLIFLLLIFSSCFSLPIKKLPNYDTWHICPFCKGRGVIENFNLSTNGKSKIDKDDTEFSAYLLTLAFSEKIDKVNEINKKKNSSQNEMDYSNLYIDGPDYIYQSKEQQTCINCYGIGWIYYGNLRYLEDSSFWDGEGFAQMNYKNGSYYIGQWKNYQPNGYGKLYYNESYCYYGEIHNSKRNGFGFLINNENHTGHQGYWHDDKFIRK